MGISTPYDVPRRVKDAIDRMTTGQMGDVIAALDIPTPDCPDSDLYDFFRQRIFDWLYDPEWTEPTDPEIREAELHEARVAARRADEEARLAREHLQRLEGGETGDR